MSHENTQQLLYRIALTLLPGVGAANARKLINLAGSAEAVFLERKSTLKKVDRLTEQAINSVTNPQEYLVRAEKELKFIQDNRIKTYFFTDDNFPVRLRQCIDCPILIYSIGNADLDSKYMISVVGTRKATNYGKEVCRNLIEGLASLDVVIVSGLAYGIDTSAHRNALDFNLSTVGVLAHGLDRIYPPENAQLARRMLEKGALVTEFMSGTNPDRENFPMRNRIIAGLSDATIVVEAGNRGGALITADIANSYNRDVFAVPGRVSDTFSEGCNNLIKTNRAALVEKPEDIIYIMGWEKERKKPAAQQKLFIQLDPDQEKIVNILKDGGECSIDRLCKEADLTAGKIATGLLSLEMEGIVKSLPGKMYRLEKLVV